MGEKRVMVVRILLLCTFLNFATAKFVFVPQYELLDPRTGRSLRDPKTSSGGGGGGSGGGGGGGGGLAVGLGASESSGRPQREAQQQGELLQLPMGPHREEKVLKPLKKRVESSIKSVSRPQEEPFSDFFLAIASKGSTPTTIKGSGTVQSLSFLQLPSSADTVAAVPAAAEDVADDPTDNSQNEIPTSAGFFSSSSEHNAAVAYKWRKKYPYYGRRRRRSSGYGY